MAVQLATDVAGKPTPGFSAAMLAGGARWAVVIMLGAIAERQDTTPWPLEFTIAMIRDFMYETSASANAEPRYRSIQTKRFRRSQHVSDLMEE